MKTFLAAMIILLSNVSFASINYHGRIIQQSNNQPLQSSNVRFNIKIKAGSSCVVYEENQDNIDMSSANGYFSLNIGEGSPVFGTFDNSMKTDGSLVSCQAGGSSALSSSTSKSVNIEILDFLGGSYSSSIAQINNLQLNDVAQSISTKSLEGKSASQFIQVSGNVTQTAVQDIISGSSSAYVKPSDLTSSVAPLISGKMDKSANLSDVGSPSSARSNLGLGSLAVLNSVSDAQITDLAYSKLSGLPATFAPSAHSHAISDITGLQTVLDGKLVSSKLSLNCLPNQTVQYISVSDSYSCQLISISSGQVSGLGSLATKSSVSDSDIIDLAYSKLTGAPAIPNISGKMDKSANLSDFASVSSARTNLGLGSLATKSSVGDSDISALAYSKLTGAPTLGTSSSLNVPASGDAASGEVVKGSDSRLTNSRAPNGSAGGDLTGSYPNPTLSVTGVTAGTYNSVTVDSKGRVTGASNVTVLNTDLSNLSATTAANQDIVPAGNGVQSLGSISKKWSVGYINILSSNIATVGGLSLGGNLAQPDGSSVSSSVQPTGFNNLYLSTADVGGTNNSAGVKIQTGNSVNGNSGDIQLKVATPTGSGTRGKIYLDAASVDVNNGKIINLATPTSNNEAANKAYVDSAITTGSGTALQKSANLSDLASPSTARTNLGLATVAATGSYNDLSNKPSFGTVTNVTATAPLAVTNGTSTPALSITAGSSAGQVLRYSGSAWASAKLVYTDLVNVSSLSPFPTTTCSAGQAIIYSSVSDSFTYSTLSIASSQVTGLGALATLSTVGDAQITDVAASKLTGLVKVAADSSSTCDASANGKLRMNGSSLEICISNSWKALGAGTIAPTVTVLTSGSGTYSVPANTQYLRIRMIGGGAGGGGSGASSTSGTNGGATTFGGILTANGGNAGSSNVAGGGGGSGGTVSTSAGPVIIQASTGAYGSSGGRTNDGPPGAAGPTPLGGGGGGISAANTGGGGSGGGSGSAFAGGGAGGYIEAIFNSPAASYSYSIGAGGNAGTGAGNGSAGASGVVIIEAYIPSANNTSFANLKYTATNSQSLATGANTIQFPTKSWDSDNLFNTGTSAMTANTAGRYHISARISATTSGTSTNIIKIYKNGVSVSEKAYARAYISSYYSFEIDDQLVLAANDIISIVFLNGTGSVQTMDNTVGRNSLIIEKIGK